MCKHRCLSVVLILQCGNDNIVGVCWASGYVHNHTKCTIQHWKVSAVATWHHINMHTNLQKPCKFAMCLLPTLQKWCKNGAKKVCVCKHMTKCRMCGG